MKVLVTGGGTGGHITPTLAVLQHLQDNVEQLETLYVIEEGDDDSMLQRKQIRTSRIKSGKVRRFDGRSLWWHISNMRLMTANIRDIFRVLYGIIQSFQLIKRFRPDVIFIKGGYVGVPIGLAAGLLNVPYIIHDSDAVPGLANKILAPKANSIAVGFPVHYYDYPSNKAIYTGNPVRKEFVQGYDKGKIRKAYNINNTQPVILIVGGSSGAKKINELIINTRKELLEIGNVIHITGAEHMDDSNYINTDELHKNTYQRYDFIHDFHKALYLADVVVSRAGASSIAEIAAMQKAAILIPHPHLTGGHQLKNARIAAEMKAAIVIQQYDLAEDYSLLLESVRDLLTEKAQMYRENIRQLHNKDAAKKLATIIIEEARSGKKEES